MCPQKFSEHQRKRLFTGFWQSGNFDVKNSYLCGCVKILNKKKVHKSTNIQTEVHVFEGILYMYVKNGAISEEVCKAVFLGIHGISNGQLYRAIQAQIKTGGSPHSDERGRHTPGNKVDEDDIAFIKKHIESFPCYLSHYSRHNNPHSLSPELSVSKVYHLYKEKQIEKEGAATNRM